MRKLKFQMQLSVDGYVAGPNGEMDWLICNWDKELENYVAGITHPVDTIILGRKLAEGFIDAWKEMDANPDTKDEFTGIMNHTPKIIFSKTLEVSKWKKATLAKGDIVTVINNMKNSDGGDIIAYGGATLASELIKHNLIDEYHLFINPIILGGGLPIFSTTDRQKLKLVKVQQFECGILLMHYTPADKNEGDI